MNDWSTVFIVIKTCRSQAGDYDFSTMVFKEEAGAVNWIEEQISYWVSSCKLDEETDVDGWLVLLDGWNSTVQYALEEKTIL